VEDGGFEEVKDVAQASHFYSAKDPGVEGAGRSQSARLFKVFIALEWSMCIRRLLVFPLLKH
jgi:hypothetical protein